MEWFKKNLAIAIFNLLVAAFCGYLMFNLNKSEARIYKIQEDISRRPTTEFVETMIKPIQLQVNYNEKSVTVLKTDLTKSIDKINDKMDILIERMPRK